MIDRLSLLCFAVVFISIQCLAADAIVQLGDGQSWTVRRFGRTPQVVQNQTNTIRSPAVTVATAMESAHFSNKAEFLACFTETSTSDFRTNINALFQEWQSFCNRYTYLVVDEAMLTSIHGKESNHAAVSTVPFGLNPDQQDTNTVSGLSPKVSFLVKTNGVWKINVAERNDRISEFLLKGAMPLVYRSDLNTLKSRDELAGMIRRIDAERQDTIINGMRKAGTPDAIINGMNETFELEGRGVVITNWAGWKRQFSCKELSPPVIYDKRDPFAPNFSTPLSAQRSYRHVLYLADGKTLNNHIDDAQRKSFDFIYGKNWVSTRTNYTAFPKLTKFTVLFTAATKFQGVEYAMVFVRVEEGVEPKKGIVTFQADIFKKTDSGYLKTSDFDNSGTFGNPCRAARVGSMLIPRYPKFIEAVKSSEFPEYYYLVEE